MDLTVLIGLLLDTFRTKYVSGLNCSQFPPLTRINEIAIQPNLKHLCLKIEEKVSTQLYELMDRLPECTELRVTGWPNVTIKDLFIPLISRINKFENIYLDCEPLMKFTINDAIELNAARFQLDGSSKLLCIHLNKETTITDIMGLFVINMISIQIEQDEDMKCPLCSSDTNKNLKFLQENNFYRM